MIDKKIISLFLGLILFLQKKRQARIRAKTKAKIEISLKLPVIITTKRVTISNIIIK